MGRGVNHNQVTAANSRNSTAASQDLQLQPFSQNVLNQAQSWFDEETRRFLAKEDWLYSLLNCDEGVAFTAFEGKEAVGVIQLIHDTDRRLGIMLLVAPEKRGQGVGQKMLQAALKLKQYQRIHLWEAAIDHNNKASINCFEKLGFRELAEITGEEAKAGEYLVYQLRPLEKDIFLPR